MNRIMISNAISILLSPFVAAIILEGFIFEAIPFSAFLMYLIYFICFFPFIAILYFARASMPLQLLLCMGVTFLAALCLEWLYFEPNDTMLLFLLASLFAGFVYFIVQQLVEKRILSKLSFIE